MSDDRECPGCDFGRGVVCDDCLDLLESRLSATDILGGTMGCLILVMLLALVGVVVLGWR